MGKLITRLKCMTDWFTTLLVYVCARTHTHAHTHTHTLSLRRYYAINPKKTQCLVLLFSFVCSFRLSFMCFSNTSFSSILHYRGSCFLPNHITHEELKKYSNCCPCEDNEVYKSTWKWSLYNRNHNHDILSDLWHSFQVSRLAFIQHFLTFEVAGTVVLIPILYMVFRCIIFYLLPRTGNIFNFLLKI